MGLYGLGRKFSPFLLKKKKLVPCSSVCFLFSLQRSAHVITVSRSSWDFKLWRNVYFLLPWNLLYQPLSWKVTNFSASSPAHICYTWGHNGKRPFTVPAESLKAFLVLGQWARPTGQGHDLKARDAVNGCEGHTVSFVCTYEYASY